ncbi:MAG TPA: squalene synthase HpnC [Noviherbaspirillum sp.]|jgi:squalene synthase HpnC|uniref:squalene synthase HpnC n=1 Tax=Noviherbaspirillum sp. TaxID=1926288 RepID=UPI002DDD87EA|nr:squalene synthase HpnC [Noviherbaspirillum sp.]HEV2612139.1 squalene synthase HpnC [Noviherbaspirillum sp.]
MPIDHYENFPVASLLLPARLRPAVESLYAFARSADDLADEGDSPREQRLHSLTAYEAALDRIENRQPAQSPMFALLTKTVIDHRLPVQPMRDLLSAFKQDVVKTRYQTFDSLLDYCRRSANPVGHLMLHLYRAATPDNVRDSDAICTALQLINFWQDVAIDWKKQRIYLPLDDMARHAVDERHIDEGRVDSNWRSLMKFEVERARSLMLSGAPLALRLPGRIGWELRLIVQGGLRILDRLEAVEYDMFRQRPKLRSRDWMVMGIRACRMKISLSTMQQVG